MSQTISHLNVASKAATVRGPSLVALAWRRLVAMAQERALRRQLEQLDARMLQDLGISEAQAGFMASRALILSETLR